MLEQKNIVFETTGGSPKAILYLKKLITDVKEQGYQVKIVFPHAPINIIKDRVYVRGLPSEEFLESSYNHACECFEYIASIYNEIVIYDSSTQTS